MNESRLCDYLVKVVYVCTVVRDTKAVSRKHSTDGHTGIAKPSITL